MDETKNIYGQGVGTSLAMVFSVAAGLAVGNLYWAQPLLAAIAADFDVPASQGSFLITATQIGYASGILLLVPLGDIVERKRLLTAVMGLTVLALFLSALAPSFAVLSFALYCVGAFTVSGQVILPLVGDLTKVEDMGRIVGIVTSGITAGILFSRFLSGLVADIWSWRSIYFLAAALNLATVFLIRQYVPQVPGRSKISYGQALRGVFSCLGRYPGLWRILIKPGMVFGITFNLFWTALTFLLSAEPFGYSTFQIGLVSMAGLTGAIAGMMLGKLQDRGLGRAGLCAFTFLSMACMLIALPANESIAIVVIVAAVFSLASQGVGILSQSQLFSLSDTERSRLNTVFVVNNFLFCAIGSTLAGFLWNAGGWDFVAVGGTIASGIAFVVCVLEYKL